MLKINKKTISLFFFVLGLSILLIQLMVSDKNTGFTCTSVFSLQDASEDFSATSNLFLSIKNDAKGYFDLTGRVRYQGQEFVLSRSYTFIYQQQDGNIYYISQLSSSKRSADNSPDNIIEKHMITINHDAGKYLKIIKIRNGYLIGNFYSPLFFCISGPLIP